MKEYPLTCDSCEVSELISKRKIYTIEVSGITLNKENNEYPHSRGDERFLQICEHCFVNSDIDKILSKQNRQFK